MKLLFIGDVFGAAGRTAVAEAIPKWRDEYSPDLIIANAENSAHGAGATKSTLEELTTAGVEAFTFGDHYFDKDFSDLLDFPIVRPANFAKKNLPGEGARIIETALEKKVLLINLCGKAFMKPEVTSYFDKADEILERFAKDKPDTIFVDMHGEVTSEKAALANHLDGRVTAVIGTHTHVPTADTRLLPGGTAFQSDAGFCGALDSVIGIQPETAMPFLRRELGEDVPKQPGIPAETRPYVVDAVLVEAASGTQAKAVSRLTSRP